MKNKLPALISCEFRKIFSQRKYRIYPVIVSLFVAGGAALSLIPGNALTFTLANYTYIVLSMLSYVFLPVGIFMLASDLVGGEMSGGTIKLLFTRASRGGVLLSKAIAAVGYTAMLALSQLILSSIITIAGGGSLNVFTAIAAYAIGLLPMIALTSMAMLVAALTRSSTSSFALNLLIFMGSGVLSLVLSGIAPALFTTYLGMGGLVTGSTLPLSSLAMGIAVCTGSALAFLSVAGIRFSNVEV